jgi:prepilin-type processing-associated H-X9-DG protein
VPMSGGQKWGCLAALVLIGTPVSCELIHDLASARVKSRQSQCRNNLKALSEALLRYAADHKHHLPDAVQWREAIRPYLKPGQVFTCPNAKMGDGYAMEQRLSNADLDVLENPAETILLYETDAPQQRPRPPLTETRHGAPNIAFADGHVKYAYGEWQKKAHTRHEELLAKSP